MLFINVHTTSQHFTTILTPNVLQRNCPTCCRTCPTLPMPCLEGARRYKSLDLELPVEPLDGDGADILDPAGSNQCRIVPMFREFGRKLSFSISSCHVVLFSIFLNRLLILLPSFSRCYCNFEQWRMEYLQSTGALVHHPVNTTGI